MIAFIKYAIIFSIFKVEGRSNLFQTDSVSLPVSVMKQNKRGCSFFSPGSWPAERVKLAQISDLNHCQGFLISWIYQIRIFLIIYFIIPMHFRKIATSNHAAFWWNERP